jgi:hypothetical protein
MSRGVMRWAIALAVASSSAGVAASGVVVSYRAPHSVVLHEPVIVEVQFSNQSAHSVRFDLGFNRQAGFTLRITSPDGTVHEPRIVPRDVGRIGRLTLEPYEERSHQLLLNDWLPFDQLGAYDISIRLTPPIVTSTGALVETSVADQFSVA